MQIEVQQLGKHDSKLFIGHWERTQQLSVLGQLVTGEPQTIELTITVKTNLIFVASTLVTWTATLIYFYFNCGVILERKASILYIQNIF